MKRVLAKAATQEQPALVTVPNLELLEVGEDWATSTGSFTWSLKDLQSAIASQDDPFVRTPIVKLGHVDKRFDGQPSLGRVKNLHLSDNGQTLLGDLVGTPTWLAECMASAFPRRSIEGYFDFTTKSGNNWPFVLTGLALLGDSYPAIESLEDVQALFGGQPPILVPASDIEHMADVAAGGMIADLVVAYPKNDRVFAAGPDDEERDDHGRWTGGGGSGSDKELADAKQHAFDATRKALTKDEANRTREFNNWSGKANPASEYRLAAQYHADAVDAHAKVANMEYAQGNTGTGLTFEHYAIDHANFADAAAQSSATYAKDSGTKVDSDHAASAASAASAAWGSRASIVPYQNKAEASDMKLQNNVRAAGPDDEERDDHGRWSGSGGGSSGSGNSPGASLSHIASGIADRTAEGGDPAGEHEMLANAHSDYAAYLDSKGDTAGAAAHQDAADAHTAAAAAWDNADAAAAEDENGNLIGSKGDADTAFDKALDATHNAATASTTADNVTGSANRYDTSTPLTPSDKSDGLSPTTPLASTVDSNGQDAYARASDKATDLAGEANQMHADASGYDTAHSYQTAADAHTAAADAHTNAGNVATNHIGERSTNVGTSGKTTMSSPLSSSTVQMHADQAVLHTQLAGVYQNMANMRKNANATMSRASMTKSAQNRRIKVSATATVDDIRNAFYEGPGQGPDKYWWWIREIRVDPSEVIVDDDAGNLYRVPFVVDTESDGQKGIHFSDPQQIKVQYVDIVAAGQTIAKKFGNPVAAGRPIVRATIQSANQKGTDMQLSAEVLTTLGLTVDATEEEVNAALAAKLTPAAEPVVEPVVDATITPITPAIPDGMVLMDAATLEELKNGASVAASLKADKDEQVQSMILDNAVRAGKFPPARRDHYKALLSADPEGTVALLESLSDGLIPVTERGTQSDPTEVAASAAEAAAYPDSWKPQVQAAQRSSTSIVKVSVD